MRQKSKQKRSFGTTTNQDIYQRVTERVIELLEQGVKPWEPSHFSSSGFPHNFSTGKPYSGINVFLLGMQRYASPWWLTFLQAKELGGNVKKGEKGSLVVKYGEYSKTEENDNGEEQTSRRGFLKGYTVFNACQIEGVSFPEPPKRDPLPDSAQLDEAKRIVADMPNPPAIYEGRYSRAFYRPSTDTVDMPDRSVFRTEVSYFKTLLHELSHSTGHPSRLARPTLMESKGINAAGEEDRSNYSKEELVAEMGAAFLAAHAGILEPDELEDSAAYLQGWIKVLKAKDNRRWIVSAASQAQQAADYILDVRRTR